MSDDMGTEDTRMATLDERRYATLKEEVEDTLNDVRAQTGVMPKETPARRFGRLVQEKLEHALEAAEDE